MDYLHEEMKINPPTKSTFMMPDGESLLIGTERFRSAELLFKPKSDGFEYEGIHELVYSSI